MSLTAQHLKELLANAASNNQRLKNIIDGANGRNLSMDNAAKAALAVAQLMFAENQPANTVSAATVRTFESVLYGELSQASGVQFDAASHNELMSMRQQAAEYVQKKTNSGTGGNPFLGGGNSGGSSNPFLANSSGGNSNSSNPFLGGGNSNNNNAAAANPFLNNGSTTAAAQEENIFTSAPPKPAETQAAPAAPAQTQVPEVEITSHVKAGHSMETYRDHELTVDYTTQAQPPRKTNETLKQFKLNGDWADRVRDGLDKGKAVISFDDAEIICKLIEERRTFGGYCDSSKGKFDELMAEHHQALADINNLEDVDDIGVIMERVNGAIKRLRESAVNYYRYVDGNGELQNTIKMDVSAMVACYLNRLEELVLNGFRIGSEQCTTPDGRRFSINNPINDLADFADSVFSHYCDNNGVCKEPDYFRELFLSVAAQLKKLKIKLQESGEVDIEMPTFQIVTAGNYTNYTKENVVTVNSFGPLAEVLSSIYEVVNELMPYAVVEVHLPTGTVELLQSLDSGAPIRY